MDESKILSMKGWRINLFHVTSFLPLQKQLLVMNWVEESDKEDRNDQTGPECSSLV